MQKPTYNKVQGAVVVLLALVLSWMTISVSKGQANLNGDLKDRKQDLEQMAKDAYTPNLVPYLNNPSYEIKIPENWIIEEDFESGIVRFLNPKRTGSKETDKPTEKITIVLSDQCVASPWIEGLGSINYRKACKPAMGGMFFVVSGFALDSPSRKLEEASISSFKSLEASGTDDLIEDNY